MTSPSLRNLGLIGISLFAGVVLTLAIQSILPQGMTAYAADEMAAEVDLTPPPRWTMDSLNAMDLEDLGDIDWITVQSGSLRNAETSLFEGDNIVVVWDAGPATLVMDAPSSLDEFVLVLKGELVLTDTDGNSATYGTGDMFMLPKGFMGTWDMTEEYRELIVVDTSAYLGE